ncbi:hypothetical protein ABW19_dt0201658 [Dactylella cylindrospora]|nr:hypothetical protein ABW19_dt0201658 [Dactylella cylindrospora]
MEVVPIGHQTGNVGEYHGYEDFKSDLATKQSYATQLNPTNIKIAPPPGFGDFPTVDSRPPSTAFTSTVGSKSTSSRASSNTIRIKESRKDIVPPEVVVPSGVVESADYNNLLIIISAASGRLFTFEDGGRSLRVSGKISIHDTSQDGQQIMQFDDGGTAHLSLPADSTKKLPVEDAEIDLGYGTGW